MKKIIFYLILLGLIVFQFLPLMAMAAETGTVNLPDPLSPKETPGSTSIPVLAGIIIKAILGIVGSLAFIMFIYGGFTWMTAAGSEQRVKTGRDILVWAVLGLVVIFASYAILKFVFTALGVGG